MKKHYDAPTIVEYGTIADLTAALGSDSMRDYSEYPAHPPSTGSWDICKNRNPDGTC